MSALVITCDREYSFVWLPRFVSNVYRVLSSDLTKDVVLKLFVLFGSFSLYLFYEL